MGVNQGRNYLPRRDAQVHSILAHVTPESTAMYHVLFNVYRTSIIAVCGFS